MPEIKKNEKQLSPYNELGFLENIENWQNGGVLIKSFEFCIKKRQFSALQIWNF